MPRGPAEEAGAAAQALQAQDSDPNSVMGVTHRLEWTRSVQDRSAPSPPAHHLLGTCAASPLLSSSVRSFFVLSLVLNKLTSRKPLKMTHRLSHSSDESVILRSETSVLIFLGCHAGYCEIQFLIGFVYAVSQVIIRRLRRLQDTCRQSIRL